MPAPRDEPADPLSLLQKQLILSQVQILELEDLRDELKTTVAQRTQVLNELQTVADRALADAQHAQAAEIAARDERQKLQLTMDSLRRETEAMNRRLDETQSALTAVRTTAATQTTRIEALDEELRKTKSSRSWRWTSPLRSIEKLFR